MMIEIEREGNNDKESRQGREVKRKRKNLERKRS